MVVNRTFQDLFLHDGVLLNTRTGQAQPTHIKGNVLDFAIAYSLHHNPSLVVVSQRVAGSDHFPVVIKISCAVPDDETPLRWSTFADFPVETFLSEVSPFLVGLHTWLASRLWCQNLAQGCMLDTLVQGAALLGVILLGTLFQSNSPYGRFARAANPRRRRGRFPKRLREAIDRMRSSRGSSLHRMQRRSVSRLMRKFNRQRLATCRNVHRLVREEFET